MAQDRSLKDAALKGPPSNPSNRQRLGAFYGAEAVMVMLAALSSVPIIVTVTESLPKSIRFGARRATAAPLVD